jgi:hypothetical protein
MYSSLSIATGPKFLSDGLITISFCFLSSLSVLVCDVVRFVKLKP